MCPGREVVISLYDSFSPFGFKRNSFIIYDKTTGKILIKIKKGLDNCSNPFEWLSIDNCSVINGQLL